MSHTLDITFGPEAEFASSGAALSMQARCLDDTRFFVSYGDQAASEKGKVSIGSVSGSTITFGSGHMFHNGTARSISSDKLEDDKIIVTYVDWDDSLHGTSKIGTVSGLSVSFGAEYEFLVGTAGEVATISLSATKFVVAYRDESNSNHGTAKIGTVSGTTITFGSAFEFLSEDGVSYLAMVRLDDDKFVLAYKNEFDVNKGDVLIGSVSGNDIAFGTPTRFLDSAVRDMQLDFFDSNKFILVHNGLTSPSYIGTVSGTDITLGISADMSPPAGWNTPAVGVLDAEHFITAFRDRTDANRGSARIGNVAGTTITLGAKNLFNTPINGTAATQVCVFDSSKFVVLYQDDSDSSHGTAKVGTVPLSVGSIDFFVRGPDFFASSLGTPESPNLHIVMSGSISGVPQPTPVVRIINHLTKTHDYNPQLVTKFIGVPDSVNIQLWNVVDGNNTLVTIANSGCYSIGNTNRWAWSTEHLPFVQSKRKYHYYFKMISDLNEETFGEFLIDVPEGVLWSSPD